MPDRYADMRDGKLQNEAVFDWANNSVNMHDGDKHPTGALKPGDQDLLSAPFQFAQQGSRLKDFTFSLASGRKFYQDVPFEIRGQATLRLGGKPVDAVVLHGTYEDRVFDFWLAPQWSNLPVRMVIVLGKDAPIDVVATEVTIEGTTVLEPPIAGVIVRIRLAAHSTVSFFYPYQRSTMILTPVQYDAVLEALDQILPFSAPADVCMSRMFRENKRLGARDRTAIAETVFALLRNLPKLKWVAGADAGGRLWLLALHAAVEKNAI